MIKNNNMILICYGTRPEWIKISPLLNEFNKNNIKYKTLFTGQHENIVSQDADFKLNISQEITSRLDAILQSCMNISNEIFNGISHVIVQGDTTSALAMSIAAFHRKLQIIHLEAGLRTNNIDNPYPEEMNRQLISRMANIHFCPTKNNLINLVKENINCDRAYIVGNTALDNLLKYKSQVTYNNKVLITLHRRENHKDIEEWFKKINELAEIYFNYEFIFPMHPNPNVQKYKHLLPKVKVIDPISHDELINILLNACIIITDSGGLQEECSFFRKKCLVCRQTTERLESLHTTSFLIQFPENLYANFRYHLNHFNECMNDECPYGDGTASKKITQILKKIYYD